MIYLDYNATTPVCDKARRAMLPLLAENFGNASSVHSAGRAARAAIDDARDRISTLLSVQPHELIFTSGGTESNNLGVIGLALANTHRGKHLVSARTEHHAVLNAVEHLEKRDGFEVSWVEVEGNGMMNLNHLADSIRDDTSVVSFMYANNETGAIHPLREISQICRERGVLLHSDMVQSFGKLETDLSLVDAASFAAHKFYGPKGAGLLFVRAGIALEALQFGGAHENQRRPGTENCPAIAGMAAAAEFVEDGRSEEQDRQRAMRDQLRDEIHKIPGAHHNGEDGLANTLNVSFPGLESETLLMALDLEGVGASSGSACMVGSVVASHVLLAMGLPLEIADSAVRLSLGKFTTADEVNRAGKIVGRVVDRLSSAASRRSSGAYASV